MEIPSSWPPPEHSFAGSVVPLFPLPKVYLFPRTILQLHIFEQRYRQMIEDSLDGPGRLVIGTIFEDHEDQAAGSPPVYPIAGLGEIARHERLEDGRFMIALFGLCRCSLREVASDRPYRKVRIDPVDETPADERVEPELRGRLEDALEARTGQKVKLPGDLPLGCLADMLLSQLHLPNGSLQELFSCLDVGQRARKALAEHAKHPPRPREQ